MAKAGCYLRHYSGFDVYADQRSATTRGHRRFHGYLLYNLYHRAIALAFDIIRYIFIPPVCPLLGQKSFRLPVVWRMIWLAFCKKIESELHEKKQWFVCYPDFRLAINVLYM